MKLKYLIKHCFIFFIAFISISENYGQSLVQKIDSSAHIARNEFAIPGLSVALIQNGKVRLQENYGLAKNTSADSINLNTVFNVASISKSLTAWGVMNLIEQKELSLSDSFNTISKSFQIQSDSYNADAITIKNLLSHTSGIDHMSFRGHIKNTPNRIDILKDRPIELISEPGTSYRYSGINYILLEIVIEQCSGMTFQQYMQKEILSPLKMFNSSFGFIGDAATSAVPHNEWGDALPYRDFPSYSFGGFNTTIEDLSKFLMANFYNSSNPILSDHSLKLLHQKVNESYGLGFTINHINDSVKLVGHSGYNVGWQSLMILNPEKGDGLIVLTNSSANGWEGIKEIACSWTTYQYDISYERYCQETQSPILSRLLASNSFEESLKKLEKIVDEVNFSENELNELGYRLLFSGRVEKAIKVFKYNVSLFPESSNAYDSLAESYLSNKEYRKALKNYEKSLKLNPNNINAMNYISKIKNTMKSDSSN